MQWLGKYMSKLNKYIIKIGSEDRNLSTQILLSLHTVCLYTVSTIV